MNESSRQSHPIETGYVGTGRSYAERAQQVHGGEFLGGRTKSPITKAAAIFEGAIGRLEPETGNSLLPRHGTWADVEAEIARLAGPLGRSDAMQASASPTQENALLARSAKWEAKHGPAPSPPQSSRRRASCWRRGWRSLRPLCRNRYSSARRL
jgi:hypothetical protein